MIKIFNLTDIYIMIVMILTLNGKSKLPKNNKEQVSLKNQRLPLHLKMRSDKN